MKRLRRSAYPRGWPCDTRDDVISVNTRRERRRWPCDTRDDHKRAVFKLDKGLSGKGRIYPNERFVHFATADILRQHAEEYDILEDTEFKWVLIWMRIASFPYVVSCGVVCRNSRACLSFYLDAIALAARSLQKVESPARKAALARGAPSS